MLLFTAHSIHFTLNHNMKIQPFHSTLQKAIDEGIRYLAERGANFNSDQLREPFTFDGVKYGQTKEAHCEIESFKGKNTHAFAHLTIWRSNSGQYEVNSYIL